MPQHDRLNTTSPRPRALQKARGDTSAAVTPAEARVVRLQRTAGNSAVSALLGSGARPLQRVRARRAPTEPEEEYQRKLAHYNGFKAKGEGYARNLETAIAERDSGEDKSLLTQFAERYETKMSPNGDIPVNIRTNVTAPESYIKAETGVKGKESAYVNYASPQERTLIASWNYASKDTEGPGQRLSNSEILYQQYRAAEGNLADLQRVIRSSIENKDTMSVMDMCSGSNVEKSRGKTYAAGTDDFNALLGTDNCKGVAFMLTDHARESGGKRIASITMYPDRIILNLS